MNEEENLEVAKENARKTYAAIVESISPSLVQKENQFVEALERHKGNGFTKLRYLFDFLERLYGAVSRFTPCKKGCNSCCHYPVSISDLEIAFIEQGTGVKRSKAYGEKRDYSGVPCPFLKGGACGIYEFRPFVCRTHVALTRTAYWCAPNRCQVKEFPMLRFSEVDKGFLSLASVEGNLTSHDIRQVFTTPKL